MAIAGTGSAVNTITFKAGRSGAGNFAATDGGIPKAVICSESTSPTTSSGVMVRGSAT